MGDKQVAGVPFQHHFTYSDTQATAFRSKSAKEFAQIRALMVESQQSLLDTDYSQKLTEYNAILDKLLPLPESTKKSSVPEPTTLLGAQISNHFSGLGYDLSEFYIEPHQQYIIPPELIYEGKFSIEIEDLPKLLAHNHQPPEEFEQKLTESNKILAKLLSITPVKSVADSPERP